MFFSFSLIAFSDDYTNYNSLYSESIILKGVVVIAATENVTRIINDFICDLMLTPQAIERPF